MGGWALRGGRMPRCPFLLLMYIILGLLCQAGLGVAEVLVRMGSFSLHPKASLSLSAQTSASIQVQLAYYHKASTLEKLREHNVSLELATKDPDIARIAYRADTLEWGPEVRIGSSDDDEDGEADADPRLRNGYQRLIKQSVNLTLEAIFIGRTAITLRPKLPSSSLPSSSDEPSSSSALPLWENPTAVSEYPVKVTRSAWAKKMNAIFVSTLGCLIIVANVMMGAELRLDVVKKTLRRPVAPCIGLACQFLAMPLLGFALAQALLVPVGEMSLALGLFVSGCVPGGGASNFWTVLLEGNADLSITMTFVSTIAALGLLPAWMAILGHSFLPQAHLQIPYKNIAVSLAILVGPILLGLAINRWLPKVAALSRKVLRPFLILILLFIVSFGTYANLYMFSLMSWRVVVGGLLLPFCGFWFGCFAALLSRQAAADVAAIAIETGVQNSGIAIMLLKLSFAEPDGDIASVVPVIVSITTPAPLLLGYSIHLLRRLIKGKKGDEDVEAEADKDEEPAEKEANGLTILGQTPTFSPAANGNSQSPLLETSKDHRDASLTPPDFA